MCSTTSSASTTQDDATRPSAISAPEILRRWPRQAKLGVQRTDSRLPRLTANVTVLTYGADRFCNRSRRPSAIDPARSLMVSIPDSRFAPLPLPVLSLPASVARSRLGILRDGRAYAGGQFWKRCVACERVR